MTSVKGSSSYNYDQSHYGIPFQIPTKTKSTTEVIIDHIVSSTTEIITGSSNNATNTTNINDTTTSTWLDETIQSNATSTVNNQTSILNNTFGGSVTETIQNSSEAITVAINTVADKTESAIEDITTTLANIIPSSTSDDNSTLTEHDMYTNYHNTSYVIMGVLIGILILITIILAAIYIFYKKRNSAHISSKYSNRASQEIASLQNLNQTVIAQQSPC